MSINKLLSGLMRPPPPAAKPAPPAPKAPASAPPQSTPRAAVSSFEPARARPVVLDPWSQPQAGALGRQLLKGPGTLPQMKPMAQLAPTGTTLTYAEIQDQYRRQTGDATRTLDQVDMDGDGTTDYLVDSSTQQIIASDRNHDGVIDLATEHADLNGNGTADMRFDLDGDGTDDHVVDLTGDGVAEAESVSMGTATALAADHQAALAAVTAEIGYPLGIENLSVDELKELKEWMDAGIEIRWDSTVPSGTGANLQDMLEGLNRLEGVFGAELPRLLGLEGGGTLAVEFTAGTNPGGVYDPADNSIDFYMPSTSSEASIETVIHEMAHAIDYNLDSTDGGYWSEGTDWNTAWGRSTGWADGSLTAAEEAGAASDYGTTLPREDFAEFLLWYIESEGNGVDRSSNSRRPDTDRIAVFENMLRAQGLPVSSRLPPSRYEPTAE